MKLSCPGCSPAGNDFGFRKQQIYRSGKRRRGTDRAGTGCQATGDHATIIEDYKTQCRPKISIMFLLTPTPAGGYSPD
jgi:hypothetical protein